VLSADVGVRSAQLDRWAALRNLAIVGALIVSLLLPLTDATAEDTQSHPLKCETGPLRKEYGKTQWLVYACDDKHSLVLVSAEGNPASPFYFMFVWKDGAYVLHGEGMGKKDATQAAYDELSQLSKESVEAIVLEVLSGKP
jgi:hypothetical protein